MGNIIFNKTRKVTSPTSAYGKPAAVDFYIPEYSPELSTDLVNKNPNRYDYKLDISPKLDSMTITLMPNGRILIPSGIRVIINDPNTCLLAVNKSGIASKKGLIIGAALIDEDYTGEIHLNLINTTRDIVQLKTGDKVVQFMHLPIIRSEFQEVCSEDFDKLKPDSKRGDKGFGSSGT